MNLRELEPTVARKVGEVILKVEGVSLAFGGVKALSDVSFDVREHEVRASQAVVDAYLGVKH